MLLLWNSDESIYITDLRAKPPKLDYLNWGKGCVKCMEYLKSYHNVLVGSAKNIANEDKVFRRQIITNETSVLCCREPKN